MENESITKMMKKFPSWQQAELLNLQIKDPGLFYRTLLILTRHRRIVTSGNRPAWNHMRQDEQDLLRTFLPDL